jgi:hypothetical protein
MRFFIIIGRFIEQGECHVLVCAPRWSEHQCWHGIARITGGLDKEGGGGYVSELNQVALCATEANRRHHRAVGDWEDCMPWPWAWRDAVGGQQTGASAFRG